METEQTTGSGRVRSIWPRLMLISAATFWLALMAVSWADAAEPAGEDDGTGEYSFSWLDPEKKIYVLQNRRYLKGQRLFLSATAGTGLSNPYRTTFQVDPRAAYYINETFGIEVFYMAFSSRENSTFEALKQAAANTLPVVREVKSQYGVLAHYVPWYAKLNVFNNILYFDWYFAGGIGQLATNLDKRTNAAAAPNLVPQNFTGVFIGTGHQYHLSDRFVIRLDLTGAFYQAPLFGDSGDSSLYSNYTLGIGLGLRL